MKRIALISLLFLASVFGFAQNEEMTDVCAPGVNIKSLDYHNTSGYTTMGRSNRKQLECQHLSQSIPRHRDRRSGRFAASDGLFCGWEVGEDYFCRRFVMPD